MCGEIHQSGVRCPEAAARQSRRRGNSTQRGYDYAWQQLSATVIAEEVRCRDCGHTGSPDNPLTCDHIIPKVMGGTDDRSNLTCRCRLHNSRKGSRPARPPLS